LLVSAGMLRGTDFIFFIVSSPERPGARQEYRADLYRNAKLPA
jgi:hypothetical protein